MNIVRPARQLRALIAAAALVGAVAAAFAATHAQAAATKAQVRTGETGVGRILVDAKGRSLYMFAIDKGGKSACYGECAAFWPPLLTSTKRVLGSNVKASLLGTTVRRDGKLQVTYNHRPLYLFVKDTKAGQINGQGLDASGGLWWVMSPTGAVIKKTASASPPPPPTTTGTTTTTTTGGPYGP
jgi:predicted lipoprotein with Yx(FWY)xxD motif